MRTYRRGGKKGSRIRILCHNVFWFQGVPFATDQPGAAQPEILAALIQLYISMKVDLLCLQEIQNEGTARAVAERVDGDLGAHLLYRPGNVHRQYGALILSRWPLKELPNPPTPSLDRVIIRVQVQLDGSKPFVLSNVHLPSGRQRGPEGGRAQRLAEIPVAMGIAEGCTHRTDVIVGDFNERPDGPCAELLKAGGYQDAAVLCGAGEEPSTLSGSRGDQIWVAEQPTQARLFVESYFVVPKEGLAIGSATGPSTGKTFLSDHLPIGIDVIMV